MWVSPWRCARQRRGDNATSAAASRPGCHSTWWILKELSSHQNLTTVDITSNHHHLFFNDHLYWLLNHHIYIFIYFYWYLVLFWIIKPDQIISFTTVPPVPPLIRLQDWDGPIDLGHNTRYVKRFQVFPGTVEPGETSTDHLIFIYHLRPLRCLESKSWNHQPLTVAAFLQMTHSFHLVSLTSFGSWDLWQCIA
jgi:hypothetical protein